MLLKERDPAYLWDMLEVAKEAVLMLDNYDLPAFMADRIMIRATERNVELIGEAARRVSVNFQNAHPKIPWRDIIGQRNILAHEYGQIDHELLFKTVVDDIPTLIVQLQTLLPPLPDNEPGE